MADIKIDLNKLKNIKLTKEQQQYVVVGVLGVGLAIYSYWNFGLKPLNDEINKLTQSVAEKRDNLEKAKKLKGQWEEYDQRLTRVQTATQYLQRRLPRPADYNVGVSRMTKMSLEGDLTLRVFGEDKSSNIRSEFEGFQKKISLIWVDGEFHKLGQFLSRLSGEDLVYNIEEVNMLGTTDTYQQVVHQSAALAMKLITYVDISEEKK